MDKIQVKEDVNKLYFLRAVLSKISKNKDELEKNREEATKVKGEKYRPVQCLNSELLCLRHERDEKKKRLSEKKAEIVKEEYNYERLDKQKEKEATFLCKFITALYWIIPAILVTAGAFFLTRWWVNRDFSFWIALLTIPVDLIALLWDAFSVIGIVLIAKGKYYDTEKLLAEKEKKLSELNGEKQGLELNIELLQIGINSKEMELEAEALDEKNFFENKTDRLQKMKETDDKIIKEAKALHALASNEMKYVLNERDWANLDLIIYELETGRAESMKEALQQADLYIRHEEITKLIRTASLAVCQTIKDSIGTLADSISYHFRELSADISEIAVGNQALSLRLDSLIDGQELGNALLKKSAVSSEQLVKDLNRVRELQSYEHYGYRPNR